MITLWTSIHKVIFLTQAGYRMASQAGQLFHSPSGILLLDKPESRFNPMDGINLVSQFINLLLQKSHLNNYIFF